MKLPILVHILKVSVVKHGKDTPVTLGHLLNIALMWHRFCRRTRRRAVAEEEKIHREALEASSTMGQH